MRFLVPLLLIAYVLCPYDLIPDFLVGPGWLDDGAALGFLGWYLFGRRRRSDQGRRMGDPGNGSARERAHTGGGQRTNDGSAQPGTGHQDPYHVLGVSPDASPDRIKRAYRELASKYHPDKVSHLGEEFKDLAERRFKEIQQAYNELASIHN